MLSDDVPCEAGGWSSHHFSRMRTKDVEVDSAYHELAESACPAFFAKSSSPEQLNLAVAKLHHNCTLMAVSRSPDIVSWAVSHRGYWDMVTPAAYPAWANVSHDALPERGTFLDIGANIGWQTLVFARAGWNVIAIEAMARNRHVLKGSLCLHSTWSERVSLVATALGGPQSRGPCIIESSKYNNLGNGEVSSNTARRSPFIVAITRITLNRVPG